MTSIVLKTEQVWKRYLLGSIGARTLGDDIRRAWAHITGSEYALCQLDAAGNEITNATNQHFWALSDISFELRQGDIVGLVGHNGSGKSTLLKILSRVTTPTRGQVRGRGRIASLLEVGTGFHPELTGRENIFLNGTIMGMKKSEIVRKLDEIIEFSGCSRHIDTPVKRYSSGMKVKLGFSVAAHLECEIMIIDEVLAVGDRSFQTRAVEKMKDVAIKSGRTIIFVSHNLRTVQDLCDSGLVMQDGRLIYNGDINGAVSAYVQHNRISTSNRRFIPDPTKPTITGVSVDIDSAARGDLTVYIDFESPRPIRPTPGIVIYGDDLSPVLGSNTRMHAPEHTINPMSEGRLICQFENLPVHEGRYFLSAWLGDGDDDVDTVNYAIDFQFTAKKRFSPRPSIANIGPVNFPGQWRNTPAEHSSKTAQ